MLKRHIALILTITILVLTISGCTREEQGTLNFKTNGEDFIKNGFVTKDGWTMDFDEVLLSLDNVSAYILETPYDAFSETDIDSSGYYVSLDNPVISDLTLDGDDSIIASVNTVTGHYNAISWDMVKMTDGDFKGYSLVLVGTAKKDDLTVPFTIKFTDELNFQGGEFIGESRNGFISSDSSGEIEMTYHIDHMFGDYDLDENDSLNTGALGFEPFYNAYISLNLTTFDLDSLAMENSFSSEDLEKLNDIMYSLGHVGEGHTYTSKVK